ncbi:TetR/AcrR family transcriptional regulator [Aeromicrobium sp. HA]|uniref:TetR/AcrR family transcriptional regulator n=1 Tax=Aeromicrobium sp. HA TaxID=3009077 RepID=UPI0022AE8135|nr:TetR/AcrR family transcriptional regulator [Aeromicrobium sp. HA]
MTSHGAEPDDFMELAARRRMSFQRSPAAVSPRGLFDDVEPAGRFRFLVAAVVAFSGRGFHATTTRDIATVAEASPASLYTYYDTKSELLHEMSAITFRYVIDMLREIVDRGAPPVETISVIVREYLRFHAEEKIVVLVVNRDYRALGLSQLAELLGMADEIHQIVESVVRAGIEQGDFSVPDVHTATRAVLRLADVSPWFNERSSRTIDELADHHVGLILQMLGHVSAD